MSDPDDDGPRCQRCGVFDYVNDNGLCLCCEIEIMDDYCGACDGSGEGSYDGSICHVCGGSGVSAKPWGRRRRGIS